MSDQYRYANTYYRYGCEYVKFDEDLDILVSSAQYGSDEGDRTEGDFFERVNGGWVEVDVEPLLKAIRDEQWKQFREGSTKANLTPFDVEVCGPGSTTDWAHSAATQDDAERWARDNLPADLRYEVKDTRRS